jgi:hypothetical protein
MNATSTPLKIEAGKYYRARRGLIVGPLTRVSWCDRTFAASNITWKENGSYVQGITHTLDLIREVYVSDTPPADAPAPEVKTLRDEFAMAALAGFMADPNVLLPTCDFNATAKGLYAIADAMMEARKK